MYENYVGDRLFKLNFSDVFLKKVDYYSGLSKTERRTPMTCKHFCEGTEFCKNTGCGYWSESHYKGGP
jgi:hypothetical protein